MKKSLALLLFVLFFVGCAPTNVLQPSTPPALPIYVEPKPTPTYAPLENMQAGETITLTSDGNKFLWIEFRGSWGGYGHWSCISNHPEKPNDCYGADLEVHQHFFFWGNERVAYSGDEGGDLTLYNGWHKTTPIETPMMP